MLWLYVINAFAEQLNELEMYYDGVTPMEKFSVTTTDITLNDHHTWDFPVYVLDARL